MSIGLLPAAPAGAQSFGAAKEKVTLQRKLPALVHLPGDTIKVTVTSADEDGALPYDFQALLETELLKDDPNLREDDNARHASSLADHRSTLNPTRSSPQRGAGAWSPYQERPENAAV